MKQLAQKLNNGQVKILEVPIPFLQKGQLLIQGHYSVISAGTEGSTVRAAQKGYIGKARERPHQVKQVINTLKTGGITETYRAVMNKLNAYSPLGYSCAGEVIDVGSGAANFEIGDFVACGGLTASHAELVSVPANLCVKLKPDADLKQAAYNTLGAIAMQGVRQADLRLGETCGVIGLGLLGQLSCLILRAAGVRVVGIDIDRYMVDVAGKNCVDLALVREDIGIKDKIYQFTEGLGCDAVIITAASSSLDPINFAGAIARKRGTIVVVGAVPTGFDREPHYYKKELQLKMSCSYGPGRYDPDYEQKGIDYPHAYVRWTEKRNMQAFQDLIYSKKIDVSYLTTHIFKLEEAPAAYDMMLARSEPFIGILIEYDAHRPLDQNNRKIQLKTSSSSLEPSTVSIGFIGAGSYAQTHLLPNIPKNKNTSLKGVMTATSTGSRSAGERFGFEFCTSDEKDIISNEEINTIFIASRHDSHAEYLIKALKAGKHVFVEKPLCLNFEELEEIRNCYELSAMSHQLLVVGYNRRFSPLAKKVKEKFGTGPMAMIYRINAGAIPNDSWIQDPEVGGGRIVGELCHFVDFLTFINGSLPISVHATAMKEADNLHDVINVSLSYENGSIGTISYFANGDRSLAKELVEIYASGCTAVLSDFERLSIYANGKRKKHRLVGQDKGQKNAVEQFMEAITNGTGNLISFEEIYSASLITFKIIESIRSGMCLQI